MLLISYRFDFALLPLSRSHCITAPRVGNELLVYSLFHGAARITGAAFLFMLAPHVSAGGGVKRVQFPQLASHRSR